MISFRLLALFLLLCSLLAVGSCRHEPLVGPKEDLGQFPAQLTFAIARLEVGTAGQSGTPTIIL